VIFGRKLLARFGAQEGAGGKNRRRSRTCTAVCRFFYFFCPCCHWPWRSDIVFCNHHFAIGSDMPIMSILFAYGHPAYAGGRPMFQRPRSHPFLRECKFPSQQNASITPTEVANDHPRSFLLSGRLRCTNRKWVNKWVMPFSCLEFTFRIR
jgi:hypothetical protein